MIRLLLLLVMTGGLLARASEPINAPVQGASAVMAQPHVTAELIPEKTTVQPGEPFGVALHLHSDKGWHTYWINPGDAGLATTIKWTLPPGFTAGPIQWPVPEKHSMGPLMTYGYEGDVYLLTTITPPKADLAQHFEIKAHAAWLVCQEECIPGKADLAVPLDSGPLNLRLSVENKDFFAQARERLPVENTRWEVKASYRESVGLHADPKRGPVPQTLWMEFNGKSDATDDVPGQIFFLPEQPNVLSAQAEDTTRPKGSVLAVILEINGEKPEKLSGVLTSDQPLIGKAKAVYISEFPVTSGVAAAVPSGGSLPVASGNPDNKLSGPPESDGGHRPPLQAAAAPPQATPSNPSSSVPFVASVPSAPQPFLLAVLGAAFVGGLILNLMPCVLPVLSLKVFSLMRHAGENPRGAWIQGVAFTAGVVISFWVLAGLLLALRAAGNQLGWGFQMQSPGFVLALIFLFFLLALNLFGVFELGTSLAGVDAKATNRMTGLTSSFFNGALATVAATPCTAPFMGGALGFAAHQPPLIALLVFTFLALGMATPYLLLTIFPGALRFVPKPGIWMEALKQFMGFLLMATVIFLVYVFGALVGEGEIYELLAGLLAAAVGVWLYGGYQRRRAWGWLACLLAFILVFVGLGMGVESAREVMGPNGTQRKMPYGWQPWSPSAVDEALAQGRPVFVDFTAAWCLSCKVNEQVALDADSVRKAFAEKNVVLLRGDWTRSDPAISEALRQYNRDGVPLYLLFSPKEKDKPQVLPAVLTPGIVLEALKNL